MDFMQNYVISLIKQISSSVCDLNYVNDDYLIMMNECLLNHVNCFVLRHN